METPILASSSPSGTTTAMTISPGLAVTGFFGTAVYQSGFPFGAAASYVSAAAAGVELSVFAVGALCYPVEQAATPNGAATGVAIAR